jgi:hypothetical protein
MALHQPSTGINVQVLVRKNFRALWGLHSRDELASLPTGNNSVVDGAHISEHFVQQFPGGTRWTESRADVMCSKDSLSSFPFPSATEPKDVVDDVVRVEIQKIFTRNSPNAVTVQHRWVGAPLHGWFKARPVGEPEVTPKAP